jgi:hypothetical protein
VCPTNYEGCGGKVSGTAKPTIKNTAGAAIAGGVIGSFAFLTFVYCWYKNNKPDIMQAAAPDAPAGHPPRAAANTVGNPINNRNDPSPL